MANYTLIGSASIVQVLSPKVAVDMVACTIKTHPTGIIATTLIAQAAVDAGTAGPILTTLADSIETIIKDGKAVGGSGTSSLDKNGLQQYFVTFEVAYNPPGAPHGTVTADVDVPMGLLTAGFSEMGFSTLAEAEAIVDKAYSDLVTLAQG